MEKRNQPFLLFNPPPPSKRSEKERDQHCPTRRHQSRLPGSKRVLISVSLNIVAYCCGAARSSFGSRRGQLLLLSSSSSSWLQHARTDTAAFPSQRAILPGALTPIKPSHRETKPRSSLSVATRAGTRAAGHWPSLPGFRQTN